MAKAEKADGAAGARRASAILGIGLCGETTPASLAEEAAKLDVKISFNHTFIPEAMLTCHCQVKTGKAYFDTSAKPGHFTIKNINTKTLRALHQKTMTSMIVWVPPEESKNKRIYWLIFDPQRNIRTSNPVPWSHYVTPALRHHLTRMAVYSHSVPAYNRHDVRISKGPALMRRARAAYKTLKQQGSNCPIVGSVNITRMAWRHVTRHSRRGAWREKSLLAAPHLNHFLASSPTRFTTSEPQFQQMGSFTREYKSIILWYRNALRFDEVPHSLVVRIREEILYPSAWQEEILGVKDIRQSATLESWWCKKEK